MIYNAIIIGAGAAGLMTAITAARGRATVLLLDSREKIGAKILMSGGTRCNVTNQQVSEKDYNSSDLMRVRHILRAFTNQDAINFFRDIGVELVLEDTHKYFPKSNSGKTVLEALVKELKRLNSELVVNAKVTDVQYVDGTYTVAGHKFSYKANAVVIATGGLSYPATGSDGAGYLIARHFGHAIINTTPALTPLTSTEKIFLNLAGISLPVELCLKVNGKKVFITRDGFLFTHQGFSGPACLDVSRHWLRREGQKNIEVNFLFPFNDQSFLEAIQEEALAHPKRTLRHFLAHMIPERLALALLEKAQIKPEMPINQLPKHARLVLMNMCLHQELAVSGVVGYGKAEATAGGVALGQLNPKTLESLHQPNLYCVGEVCDVDGRIGGFNFQWAWSSGAVAGQAIAREAQSKAA